ncbi:MAG: heat-inducible transcriptional repressor HrcA [Acidobacteriota bacterium]
MVFMELTPRERDILRATVKIFILTGEPVPSSMIAKIKRYHLSPASVRNVMARLEEYGYLLRPHPSSGRVPTDLGYRFFVNAIDQKEGFPQWEAAGISEELEKIGNNFQELFIETSRILSRMSNNIGIVLTPNLSGTIFEHIEFIRLAARKIMVLFVARSGLLHNKVVDVNEDFSQDELDRIGTYLVRRMEGKTLIEVRDEIIRMMREDREACDSIFRNAVLLAQRYFECCEESQDLIVDGASNLFDKPEFADLEKMKELFRAFEEKSRIVKLLNECVEEMGVKILIGSENVYPEMNDCCLIASTYGIKGQSLGVLGIIGPKRIEYPRVISLVRYLSRLLNRIVLNK